MTGIQSALLTLLVVAAAAVFIWRWYKSHIFKRASRLARQVFPVWAGQGPFDSGEESAAAMHHAYLAVMGPEETERMAEAIAEHAATYDSDPATWERLRQEAADSAGPETENLVTIAKGLAAMDSLNKEFLEDGGHKLELTRQTDGNLGIAYKKIWSDEEIEEKKKQDGEAIVSGIGEGLLSDSSEEARELVAFLSDAYRANTREEPDSASAIGRAWLACLEIKNEEPDSELAQEFGRLNEAHQTRLESTEGALEWSNDPGAHEAHLMRRWNNPYFPEERRLVTQDQLDEAKRRDKEDCILCQQKFTELGTDIESLSSNVTTGDLLSLRERLDDLIYYSMGVGGPAKEIAVKADQLRDAIIADLREAFSDNEETLENIEKADAFHRDNTRKFYIPVLAQVLRKNSPVLKEETIPTILSADPLAISVFMNTLPEDSRALVRVEALKMMQEALNDGHIDPRIEEKLSALEGNWNFEPSLRADFDEGLAAAQRGDYETALREWHALAENGDATAQYNLGIMYENGWGVSQDPAQAVDWYREAAKSGNVRFILHLATMYSLGKGVPTDFVQAYMYFSVAAEMGDSDGEKGRDLHGNAMTPDQIEKAKVLAQEWRAKYLEKK